MQGKKGTGPHSQIHKNQNGASLEAGGDVSANHHELHGLGIRGVTRDQLYRIKVIAALEEKSVTNLIIEFITKKIEEFEQKGFRFPESFATSTRKYVKRQKGSRRKKKIRILPR